MVFPDRVTDKQVYISRQDSRSCKERCSCLNIDEYLSRSWNMIGIAARSGIALGLNINKRVSIFDVKAREARKHLWWSIFRLENILSVITGRVSCLGNASLSMSPLFLDSSLDMKLPYIV